MHYLYAGLRIRISTGSAFVELLDPDPYHAKTSLTKMLKNKKNSEKFTNCSFLPFKSLVLDPQKVNADRQAWLFDL